MPYKNPEDRKRYHQEYWQKWYADETNRKNHVKRSVKHSARIKKRNSDWLRQYKSGRCCKRCGESHIACLDFHHTGKNGDKENEISVMVCQGNSLEKIAAEIAKCELVCRNCHAKIHYEWLWVSSDGRVKT